MPEDSRSQDIRSPADMNLPGGSPTGQALVVDNGPLMLRTRRAVATLAAAAVLTACTAAPGEPVTPTSVPTSARPTALPTVTTPRLPDPLPTAAPASLGVDPDTLDALAAQAEDAGSTCFVVLRRGTVVGEWFWRGATPTSRREVFSVTKSVTSTLVGIAADAGLLDVDQRASDFIAPWQGTDAAPVTIRNLLSNDSGREWSATSDYSTLLKARDRTAYAVGLPQQHPPGTVWAYNNAAIQTLDAVLASATGQRTSAFAQQRLFGPLGMRHTRMTPTGDGTNLAFGMQSTCPDLARFGVLFAQDGSFGGQQVVSSAWVKAATGAPSQSLNAAYGFLWWLNREGNLRTPLDEVNGLGAPVDPEQGRIVPSAPDDLYAALGFGGQVVLVHPASETVVVRLGDPADVRGSSDYSIADAARVVTEALTDR
jgi:CubicO group peptidase (beta-lactamase class C family)